MLDNKETTAIRAAKNIIWLYGAKWQRGNLQDYGIDEAQLSKEERIELIEQLEKQENRVRALFGF